VVKLDFLNSQRYHRRAQRLIAALVDGAAGLDAQWTARPRPDAYLVLYGLGGVDRVQFAARQRLIAFDAGYWNRTGSDRSFRVSVGGFHCPRLIMQGPRPGPERWLASGLSLQQADCNGPVLLVGNGPKSNRVGAEGWAGLKSAEIRAKFPGRKIWYRPKPKRPMENGVAHDGIAVGSIDHVLQQVSLVVCRHSNVAVDACRWGVPVVCDDGAAAAIYPQRLDDWERQPDAATREEFLHRIAWWQWQVRECRDGSFWNWMLGVLDEVH
jgi:hypothetical protein